MTTAIALQVALSGCMVLAVVVAVAVDRLHNPLARTKAYQVRRQRNWLAIGVAYVFLYMARYSVVVINTERVRGLLGVSKGGYGIVLLLGFWSYATFQLVNGHALDGCGGKAGLRVGTLGCGACCALAGLSLFGLRTAEHVPPSTSLVALGVFHAANMSCNTLGSLSVVKINSTWYTKVERGVFSGIFGVMISIGYFFALVVGGWVYRAAPFYVVFLTPAGLLAGAFVAVGLFVEDDPPAALAGASADGVELVAAAAGGDEPPPVEASGTCQCLATGGAVRFDVAAFRAGVAAVCAVPRVRLASLGLFGVGWVREGFLSWFADYLAARSGVAKGGEAYTVAAFAISLMGMVGSLLGGYVSDKCFRSKRGPVALAYCAAQVAILGAFGSVASLGLPFAIAAVAALSVVLFGALTLLMGAAAGDYVAPELMATASGVINASQYAGSGTAALLVGVVVDALGWSAFAPVLMVGALTSTAAMVLLSRQDALKARRGEGDVV